MNIWLTYLSLEFTGLDENVLVKALKLLEARGKAEIIALDENSGVKFFD